MIETIVSYIVIATIAIFIFDKIQKLFINFKLALSQKMTEERFKNYAKNYLKQKDKEEQEKKYYKFFGIMEFNFENCKDDVELKKEQYSIITEKIKLKYRKSNLKIENEDKIFFSCDDFTLIEGLVDDLIKLFKAFEDINKKKYMTTTVKISFLTKERDTDFNRSKKLLREMNSFNLKNQVIVNDELYGQYKKLGLKAFDFQPMGLIKFVENNEDFEVFRLVKNNQVDKEQNN